ncbi:hypothetical protein ACMG4P_22010 [Pseudovibrio denitrificans]|uniref:hypothetical protein n=1 Tax=Pseudovibrio denitrificans TaxID=258256 RepID=UPI0039BFC0D1
MARQTVPFKQADVERVCRAYKKLGVDTSQLRITIKRDSQEVVMEPIQQGQNDNSPNPWDDLL